MDSKQAVVTLAALAHPQRLAIFRLLVREGPSGLPAGEIAEAVGRRADGRVVPSEGARPRRACCIPRATAATSATPCTSTACASSSPISPRIAARDSRSCAARLSRRRRSLCTSKGGKNDPAAQRALSVHAQFGAIDHRRMHHEPARERQIQGLQRRQPAERPRASLRAGSSAPAQLRHQRAALEIVGGVRGARRACAGFRVHRLRRRGQRDLPRLAGSADERALGLA